MVGESVWSLLDLRTTSILSLSSLHWHSPTIGEQVWKLSLLSTTSVFTLPSFLSLRNDSVFTFPSLH